MDHRRALMLQVAWGADEALLAAPQRHLRAPPPSRASPPGVAGDPSAPTSLSTNLAELAAVLAASDGAGLAATATRLVAPTGVAGSLLVVGEAPGAAEDRSGQPFVGVEGQLLRRMLASISVDPAACMLGYLAPWRPPGGRPPSELEIAVCLKLLWQLMALARPRLVLALGNVASRALLGPSMRRGRWGEISLGDPETLVPVLPSGNPAVLLKQPQQKAAAWRICACCAAGWTCTPQRDRTSVSNTLLTARVSHL